jgi:hypothetical protein
LSSSSLSSSFFRAVGFWPLPTWQSPYLFYTMYEVLIHINFRPDMQLFWTHVKMSHRPKSPTSPYSFPFIVILYVLLPSTSHFFSQEIW